MEKNFSILLKASPENLLKLEQLQENFVKVCNAIAPVVQHSKCWNRVALHHMVYHNLRGQFPEMGSQMICNAVYSVCRAARILYQHPKSPHNINRAPNAPLPRMVFLPNSPVYFDRHTLNIKGKSLSMFTLDGRVRFQISLTELQQSSFKTEKLKEILLVKLNKKFYLRFHFESEHMIDDVKILNNLHIVRATKTNQFESVI